MEMNEHGVLVTDALSRYQYSWLAFLRNRETPNLFLLYIAKSRFYMIPKRAFPDGAAVEAFRQLIRLRITERPPAFPVVADALSAVPVHAIPMAARVVRPPPLPGAAFRPPS
jgi:hypothetical protein